MKKTKQQAISITELLALRLSRRQALQASMASFVASLLPNISVAQGESDILGFNSIPVADLLDEVVVPEGYQAQIFYCWGDPVSDGPAFKMDASNTANEQLVQAGMHHDAIQFFPLPAMSHSSNHGLLVMNHEYIDPQLLHAEGGFADSPLRYDMAKTRKEQYAHGISVIEVKKQDGWQICRPSDYARRINAATAMSVSGPVAGSNLIKTTADPKGQEIIGTFNNCSNGITPWGTYLACEENFHGYFKLTELKFASEAQQQAWSRYAMGGDYYGWAKNEERFNLDKHPNEGNRFGWIIEFDPYNPQSKPVKRTALGRFAHENVAHNVAQDGRIAFYSGDDAEFEYIYKFITNGSWDGTVGAHHGALLDDGILHVAKFYEDGTGEWLPLQMNQPNINQETGFDSEADVLVHARMAADARSATPLDRPEWISVHPKTGEVFVSLTKNSARTKANAANPRSNNHFGHIIKLVENDAASRTFNWEVFVKAGDDKSGATIKGDSYANPDGLMIDKRGVLWVQTDVSRHQMNKGNFSQFGNNQMLAVDPVTGLTKRFLTGPVGCEITGVTMTPDQKTMWVNIQHPGDVPTVLREKGIIKTPLTPNAASNWPDKQANGRPRSATVLVTKRDGGVIGS